MNDYIYIATCRVIGSSEICVKECSMSVSPGDYVVITRNKNSLPEIAIVMAVSIVDVNGDDYRYFKNHIRTINAKYSRIDGVVRVCEYPDEESKSTEESTDV